MKHLIYKFLLHFTIISFSIALNAQNVGVGTTNPLGALHVDQPAVWEGIQFTGSGLNDLSVDNAAYSGIGATMYAIRIQNSGPTPNIIEMSSDGGNTWSAPMPILSPIDMGNGVMATFASDSGHTFADQWDWTVNQTYINTLVVTDGKVGIGTANPSANLEVNGIFKLTDGTEGKDKILISDSIGTASWLKPSDAFLDSVPPTFGSVPCPSILVELPLPDWPISIALQDSYAIIMDVIGDELKVIDVSDPFNPFLTGSLGIFNDPTDVAVQGNFAYVLDQGVSPELKVIDLSNPSTPSLFGSLVIGSHPVSLSVQGDFVYVVDDVDFDLKAIEITNPAAPSLAGTLAFPFPPIDIVTEIDIGYLIHDITGDLKIIDLSTPAAMSITGTLSVGVDPVALTLKGDYIYIVDDGNSDLRVIDISVPAAPSTILIFDNGSSSQGITHNDDYVFTISSESSELKMISNLVPADLKLSETLAIGDGPESVAVNSNFAYIVDQISDDLKVINLFCENQANIVIEPGSGDFSYQNLLWQKDALTQNIYNSNSGNVGIGTNSPASALDIVGDIATSGSRLRIRPDGNIGIGNFLPSSRLDIIGNIEISGSRLHVNPNGRVGIGTDTPSSELDIIGEIEISGSRLHVDPNGKVGIGTDTPASELDINGDIEISGGRLHVNSNGRVGIGTIIPASTLHVIGNIQISGSKFHVSPLGRIGIGTSAPQAELDVVGDIELSGDIIGGNDIFTGDNMGVINCGGGMMSSTMNLISDATPTPANATGDEDLYIDDDLELGSEGYKPGGGSWATASDRRLKREILTFNDGLEVLLQIQPVKYKYNNILDVFDTDKEHVGIIAQEVQKVAPYMVEEKNFFQRTVEDENGVERISEPGIPYLTYNSTALTYILVNAIKEQQNEIEAQNAKIQIQQQQIAELQNARSNEMDLMDLQHRVAKQDQMINSLLDEIAIHFKKPPKEN